MSNIKQVNQLVESIGNWENELDNLYEAINKQEKDTLDVRATIKKIQEIERLISNSRKLVISLIEEQYK